MSEGGSYKLKDGNRVLSQRTKPQKPLTHQQKINATNPEVKDKQTDKASETK